MRSQFLHPNHWILQKWVKETREGIFRLVCQDPLAVSQAQYEKYLELTKYTLEMISKFPGRLLRDEGDQIIYVAYVRFYLNFTRQFLD